MLFMKLKAPAFLFSILMVWNMASSQTYHRLIPFKEIIQKKKSAVVRITVHSPKHGDQVGTGFFYGKKGHVVTNHHILEDFVSDTKATLQISHPGENKHYGQVNIIQCTDKNKIDLCLIKLKKDKNREYFSARSHSPSKGIEVAIIGQCSGPHSFKKGKVVKVWEDVYNYIQQVKNYRRTLKQRRNFNVETIELKDSNICPGDSGGPVFGSDGELYGVVAEIIPIKNTQELVENIISGRELFKYYKKNRDKEGRPVDQKRIVRPLSVLEKVRNEKKGLDEYLKKVEAQEAKESQGQKE